MTNEEITNEEQKKEQNQPYLRQTKLNMCDFFRFYLEICRPVALATLPTMSLMSGKFVAFVPFAIKNIV